MQEIPNNFTGNVGDEWEKQDSILLKKIIAMMEYANPVLRNFPKSEKFTIVAKIYDCMDALMGLTIAVDNKHFKKNTLQEIDVTNKKLKKYILLAYRLKFIPFKQYRHWTELTAEIGKIIGGRIEAAKQPQGRGYCGCSTRAVTTRTLPTLASFTATATTTPGPTLTRTSASAPLCLDQRADARRPRLSGQAGCRKPAADSKRQRIRVPCFRKAENLNSSGPLAGAKNHSVAAQVRNLKQGCRAAAKINT